MKKPFRPGIDTLLRGHRSWLQGKRIGLVSHLATVDVQGCLTVERLWRDKDLKLVCLMGPEHGFMGGGAAGAHCANFMHPLWSLPVFSLYGDTQKPTPTMLRKVDTLLVDLQDIGARPYTYVSTLRYVLEAAADSKREVIVADRPVPLPCMVDGPGLDPRFQSFVGLIPAPMCYGMTLGETALWLKQALNLDVALQVAPMTGYAREGQRQPDWPAWIPPSPAILSWESATCYLATVFCEALQAVDCGRATGLPFQLVGAPWIKPAAVADLLADQRLPGVIFYPHRYESRPRQETPAPLNGLRLVVTDPHRFRPVTTAVSLIHALQKLYGKDRVWARRSTRPAFFDKLFGADTVRLALLDGEDSRTIVSRWQPDLRRFKAVRRRHLLYSPDPRNQVSGCQDSRKARC